MQGWDGVEDWLESSLLPLGVGRVRAGELSIFMDGSRQGWWVMELPGTAWPCSTAERDPGACRLSQAQEQTQAWGLEG